MKLRTSVLAFAISVSCAAVWAQDSKPAAAAEERPPEIYTNPNAQPQQIFYKWHARGKTHYAKYVPRGVSNYTKVNSQGMLVSDLPTSDSITVLRPLRPAENAPAAASASASASASAAAATNQPLPPGSTTREQRCAKAQKDLKTIQENSDIVMDDGNGNLVPLSQDQINERKRLAENNLRFCQPATSTGGLPVPPSSNGKTAIAPAVAPSSIPPAVAPTAPVAPAVPSNTSQPGIDPVPMPSEAELAKEAPKG